MQMVALTLTLTLTSCQVHKAAQMVAEELGVLVEQQQRTHSQRLSYSDRFGRHMVRRIGRCMVHYLLHYL